MCEGVSKQSPNRAGTAPPGSKIPGSATGPFDHPPISDNQDPLEAGGVISINRSSPPIFICNALVLAAEKGSRCL